MQIWLASLAGVAATATHARARISVRTIGVEHAAGPVLVGVMLGALGAGLIIACMALLMLRRASGHQSRVARR